MSEQNERRGDFHLPQPLESLRSAGRSMLSMVFSTDAHYYDHMRDEQQQRKTYEDDIVTDLTERIGNINEQSEIEQSKKNHPSQKGYL